MSPNAFEVAQHMVIREALLSCPDFSDEFDVDSPHILIVFHLEAPLMVHDSYDNNYRLRVP